MVINLSGEEENLIKFGDSLPGEKKPTNAHEFSLHAVSGSSGISLALVTRGRILELVEPSVKLEPLTFQSSSASPRVTRYLVLEQDRGSVT